jgi:glycosyltransferase involved in cell wall biosynthesis
VTPEVSIIIPVYNVAPYLAECLGSVLGQSFTDLEVICVDDGSSDNSPGILADYARKDSRLKVVAQEHGGPSRARNKALALARGCYIGFVDGDDFLDLKTIEKSLAHFTGGVDYVCFRAKIFREAGLSTSKRRSSYFDPPFLGAVALDEAVIRTTNVHVWNKVFRREVIERNRILFPDGLFYQDFTFTTAYLLVSRQAFYMEERLYTYRLRPDSTMARTRRSSFEHASDHIAVVMRLFSFMKERRILAGHETLLADYLVKYFNLAWQYASAENLEAIYDLAGRCLKELDADFQNKNAVWRALFRDNTEKKRKLNQITASRWHRVGRTLGLVKRLRDM